MQTRSLNSPLFPASDNPEEILSSRQPRRRATISEPPLPSDHECQIEDSGLTSSPRTQESIFFGSLRIDIPPVMTEPSGMATGPEVTDRGLPPAHMRDLIDRLITERLNDTLTGTNAGEQLSRQRRLGLARAAEAQKQLLKDSFIASGMSEMDAELEAYEAVHKGNPALSPSAQAPNTIIAAERPPRRHQFRTEDIGTFDGSPENLLRFVDRIDSLHDMNDSPHWREPLLELVPMCLKDQAAFWHSQLSKQEKRDLTTWNRWRHALEKAFSPDPSELQLEADNRKWRVREETALAYYLEKIALLRQAYPDQSDKCLLVKVRMGLPPDLQRDVRVPYQNNPSGEDFARELRQLEGPYRNEDPAKRSLRKASGSQAPSKVESSSSASTMPRREKQDIPASPTGSRKTLASSYQPGNISVGKDSVRRYRVPNSNAVIELERRCKQCGGKHFDFEHEHLTKPQVKREPSYYIEGYAVYTATPDSDGEPIVIDDSDDDDDTDVDETVASASTTPSPTLGKGASART
ncbi:unnamed protein product [Jaminaea pallidilutea]